MRRWWCEQYKEFSNRPPWRFLGSDEQICALCMETISDCGGRWR